MFWPMTPEGVQYCYIGLSLLFGVLCWMCFAALLDPKTDPGRSARFLLVLFALGCGFFSAAFFLSIIITGAHPLYSRDTIAPWTRLCYWGAFLTWAPPVVVGMIRSSKFFLGFGEKSK